MSRGERTLIGIRMRNTMAALTRAVKADTLADTHRTATVSRTHGSIPIGTRRRLVTSCTAWKATPKPARRVVRIFAEYHAGRGMTAIRPLPRRQPTPRRRGMADERRPRHESPWIQVEDLTIPRPWRD
jgi:hypothetical protein